MQSIPTSSLPTIYLFQKQLLVIYKVIDRIIKLMIIAQKYRPSMQLTLSDIFHDLNDSRKQTFMLRVKTAFEDLQIRMRNELESNNLANLQTLIKKQQTLKKMEQKLNDITQQIQEKRQRDSYLNHKINEMQTEMNKKQELLRHSQDKIKALGQTIKRLQAEIVTKDQQMQKLSQQKHQTVKQNQQVWMQKQKHQQTIRKLRNTVVRKVQQTQFILKIKEQKLAESFHESLTNLQIKNLKEKQFQSRNKNLKIEKKHQKIQVNIHTPQMNTSRMSQNTSRLQVQVRKENKQVQTEVNHQKKISQIIESSPPNNKQKLQQIRLIYSKTPDNELAIKQKSEKQQVSVRSKEKVKEKYFEEEYDQQFQEIKREQPKIVKYYTHQTVEASTQTLPVIFKPQSPIRFQKMCQANLGNYHQLTHQIRSEIEEIKRKYQKMEQFHKNRFDELVKIYEERPSHKGDLLQIDNLKLTVLNLQLQLEKKDNELANERQLLAKVSQNFIQVQNNSLLKRLNVKLGQGDFINSRKFSKVNQTCNIFISHSPKRMETQLSAPNAEQLQQHTHPRNYTSKLKRRKAEDDVITITRTKNALIYSQNRRSSLKSQTIYTQAKRNNTSYQKYFKNKNNTHE